MSRERERGYYRNRKDAKQQPILEDTDYLLANLSGWSFLYFYIMAYGSGISRQRLQPWFARWKSLRNPTGVGR